MKDFKVLLVNQLIIKNILFFITFFCLLTPVLSQNDIMARIEFEAAEELFVQEKYNEALKKIEKTESLLAKWTPKVSYLKIQVLNQLADFADIDNHEALSLWNETKAYFDFYKKNPEDIIMDKYKIVYEIDEELIFIKNVKPFKDKEEYRAGDKAYKQGDFEEAIKWFKAGIEKGNPACINYLGLAYETGKGVPQDHSEAFRLYNLAAEKNYPLAMGNLGRLYWDEKRDYSVAMQWLLKASDFKFPQAMNNVGVMYYLGLGVDQNYNIAKEWYQKAADRGYEVGLSNLGYLYYHGQGVEQNFNRAFDFYLAAAQKGNIDAMINLGIMHYNKESLESDDEKSLEWFQLATEKGSPQGMHFLGFFYREGVVVDKDFAKAAEWYEKAIAAEYNDALKDLAGIYSTGGYGLKRDKKKAKELMEKFEATQK